MELAGAIDISEYQGMNILELCILSTYVFIEADLVELF